jgi:hypothetical protein
VVGTYVSGDDDDDAAYVSLDVLQAVVGQPGRIGSIEVKALTTPENDLSRKAARNPAALTRSEWEIWYCTAYPSSIAYQIEEVVPVPSPSRCARWRPAGGGQRAGEDASPDDLDDGAVPRGGGPGHRVADRGFAGGADQ